jgi:hypothetical protein
VIAFWRLVGGSTLANAVSSPLVLGCRLEVPETCTGPGGLRLRAQCLRPLVANALLGPAAGVDGSRRERIGRGDRAGRLKEK